MQKPETTTNSIEPGNFIGAAPEFGRVADVTRIFGIRRGTLYNLLNDGKIKGALLRVRGQKSGVRLISMQSVRRLVESQMEPAGKTAAGSEKGGRW